MGKYLYHIPRQIVSYAEKAVRIIYGVKPRTHTKALFEDVKILDIFQMNKYLIGKFMFNVYKSTSLDIFMSMFVYNSSIHDHDTRQSSHFHAPLIKKELSKANVRYRGAVVWNYIMNCKVKTNESDYVFCKDLSRCVVKNIVLIRFHHLLHDYHCFKYSCLVTWCWSCNIIMYFTTINANSKL